MPDEQPDRRNPNGGLRPVPDPTALTDQAIARSDKAMRDYIDGQLAIRDERLRGIDTATNLRLGHVDTFEDQVDLKVGALKELHGALFVSVDKQFFERDVRQERESRDSKTAVDAAFEAQKDIAAAEIKANREAIDKSEKATAETIKTNQELNKATTDALTKSLDELKQAVTRIESRGIGASETRVEGRLSSGAMVAAASVIVAVITVVVTVAIFLSAAP